MNGDRYTLIIVTICLILANIGLLYFGYEGVKVPTIINLPISVALGVVISMWLE